MKTKKQDVYWIVKKEMNEGGRGDQVLGVGKRHKQSLGHTDPTMPVFKARGTAKEDLQTVCCLTNLYTVISCYSPCY